MRYVTRPLTPEAKARCTTKVPRSAPFSAAWGQTVDLLDREAHYLSLGPLFVMMIDVEERDLRLDGELRANAKPSSPAVGISIESKHGPLLFVCDRFRHWQDNVRAIALGLEALRRVERYGIVQSDEQYRGWQALPPGTPMPPAKMTIDGACRFLVAHVSPPAHLNDPTRLASSRDLLHQWYRAAVKEHHPDHGGDPETFRRLTEARDLLLETAS